MQFMHTVSKVLLCLWMAGASAAGHAQSASTPFSTPGQFAVSPSGAATYRIPIEVPPGVAGMAPKLELVYNSQGGNGLLGMGWSLSGLSAISRCPRTMASDGVRGSINFDANDRFCLDGQRLILVSGTYGAAGSEYRTELESFSQIAAVGSAGSGPASFVVKTKGGLTIEYGNTEDSRIEAVKAAGSVATWPTGTVQVWAQNKITDVKGNYLTVSYSEDSAKGSYMPSRIDYTGNASSSPAVVPGFTVNFVPFGRDRLDLVTRYQGGATFANNQRLAKILTHAGIRLIKEYRLDYAEQASAVDRSHLTAVTECDGDGVCLPSTYFRWGGRSASALSPGTFGLNGQYGVSQGWRDSSTYPRHLVDMNGDGLPDVVGFAASGVYVALNEGGRFAGPTFWLSNQYGVNQGWQNDSTYPRHLVDMNGDGLPDVVGFGEVGASVAVNKRSVLDDLVVNVTFAARESYVSYAALVVENVYTKDAGSNKAEYPKVDVQGAQYVVSKVEQSDGVGGVRVVQYSYGGLKAELGTGRGLLGFRWVKSMDQGTGIEDHTEYRQDFPYTGQVAKSETRLAGAGNAGLLKRVSNTYRCVNPATNATCVQAAGNRYFTHPSQSVEEAWDLNGAALPTVSSAHQYSQSPQWGDPTQITVGTSDGASQTTNNEYWPAQTGSGQWISGRLKRSTVTSTKP